MPSWPSSPRAGVCSIHKYGVTTRGTNALPRALDFDDIEAVRLLLEYGADPNEAVAGHPSGQPVDTIPALHQAARRWRSADVAALLLDHGATPTALWHGHTAYATARIYGNQGVARFLEKRGYDAPLSETEAILADCAAGNAFQMTDEIMAEIERILPVGWAHGDRYTRQQWVGPEGYC